MLRSHDGVLMLATVGEEVEPVLLGVRDFPVQRLVLFHTRRSKTQALEIASRVRSILVETELREVDEENMLMDMLAKVAQIQNEEGPLYREMFINVSSGEKRLTCSALSAAFVHGIPAIGVNEKGCFALPVLKFSYSELISEAKFRILEALEREGGASESLADLSKKSGIEKSLLSYHLRTTREGKGLREMGLVEIERAGAGRLTIRLTEMGRLMLVGRRPRVENL